jgi:protein Mpv17
MRTLRMFGFGFVWYGPYQYYWYNLLDWSMPVKSTASFLSKVAWTRLAPGWHHQ